MLARRAPRAAGAAPCAPREAVCAGGTCGSLPKFGGLKQGGAAHSVSYPCFIPLFHTLFHTWGARLPLFQRGPVSYPCFVPAFQIRAGFGGRKQTPTPTNRDLVSPGSAALRSTLGIWDTAENSGYGWNIPRRGCRAHTMPKVRHGAWNSRGLTQRLGTYGNFPKVLLPGVAMKRGYETGV